MKVARRRDTETDTGTEIASRVAHGARSDEPDVARDRDGGRQSSHPGARRAAIFVLSLEEDVASQLLRCLNDDELGVIAAEIAGLGLIEKDTVNEVLREFRELEELQDIVLQRGVGDAVRIAQESFHEEKAQRVCRLLELSRRGKPFAALEDISLPRLGACLREEHPQTRALVLAHLPPARAAILLKELDVDEREDLLERIESLRKVENDVLVRLADALRAEVRQPWVEVEHGAAIPGWVSRSASPRRGDSPGHVTAGAVESIERVESQLASFEAMLEKAVTSELDGLVSDVAIEDLAIGLRGLPRELQGRVFARLAPHQREDFCRVAEQDAHVDDEDVAVARAEIARALVERKRSGVRIGSCASESARVLPRDR